jgi:hypothetical protein
MGINIETGNRPRLGLLERVAMFKRALLLPLLLLNLRTLSVAGNLGRRWNNGPLVTTQGNVFELNGG